MPKIPLANKRILVIRNDLRGDLICTIPAIRAFKEQFPEIKIDLLIKSFGCELVCGLPEANNILHYHKARTQSSLLSRLSAAAKKISLAIKIFARKYDAVIVPRRIFATNALLFVRVSRATYKIGTNSTNKKPYGIDILPDPSMHEVDHVFKYFGPLNVRIPPKKKFWLSHDLHVNKKIQSHKGAIVIHISADRSDNHYPATLFSELIKKIQSDIIVITYAPPERADAIKISNETNCIAVDSNIPEFIELMRSARALISPDGGVIHIASALEKPVISLFGSPNNALRWYPYGYKNLTLSSPTGAAKDILIDEILSLITRHNLISQ